MHKRLEDFIRARDGYASARVVNLQRMAGGASKDMWSFDVQCGDVAFPMVMRVNRASPLPIAIGLEAEFRLMQAAFDHGVPLPRPYWFARDVLDAPCAILERVAGETIARRLHRDQRYGQAREVLAAQMGAALARIHSLDWRTGPLSFLPRRRGRDASTVLAELDFYEHVMRRFSPDPHPALELGLRWLRQRAPQTRESTVIHGDYRLGNVIFTESGLAAVLDWELAHIGDPMEDLTFLAIQAWRFGNDHLPIGGIGTWESFFDAYEQAGGRHVERGRIRYWEVFGNLKWAVITILQMVPFLDGTSPSIELASLGRKTAEVELQMLSLMESA